MTEIREIPIQFPNDPVQCELIATLLRDKGFHELSRQIRVALKERVKPTIEEPIEFGSIVRATCGPGLVGLLWQHSPMQGKHYWESETGAVEVWPELTDVEVLRIGVGETEATENEIDQQAAEAQSKLAKWEPVGESIPGENVDWLNGFKAGLKAAGEPR